MAKNRQNKIEKLELQIAEQQEQLKLEKRKQAEDNRKAKQKRLTTRHEFLEKAFPEIVDLTDEQYKTFITEHVTNVHGKKALAKIVAETTNTNAENHKTATAHNKNTATETATSNVQASTEETP